MCLSRVYLEKEDKGEILLEEASGIVDNKKAIEVYSIFGENKKIQGYYIKEVDFLKNTVILSKKLAKNE